MQPLDFQSRMAPIEMFSPGGSGFPLPSPGSLRTQFPWMSAGVPKMPPQQMQSWPHKMQPVLPMGSHRGPNGGSMTPREVLAQIDDVVSEMERELSHEALAKAVEKDRQMDTKVAELDRELEKAQSAHEEQFQQNSRHLQKIAELEGQIVELRRNQVNHDQDSKSSIQRITELENELGNSQASQQKYKEEHAAQSSRLAEFENAMLEARNTEERHLRHITELKHHLATQEENFRLQLATQQRRVETLEQDLENMRLVHAENIQYQDETNEKKIDLEQLLAEAEHLKETQSKQLSSQSARIRELELLLEESKDSDSKYKHEIEGLRHQIAGLENNLTEAQSAGQHHTLRQQSQRNTIAELERQLADLEAAGERQKRQHHMLSQQIDTLEGELAESRSNVAVQNKHHQSLRLKVTELEQEVHDVRLTTDKHRHQSGMHQKRAVDLQQELTVYVEASEANLKKLEATHRSRLADLEEELVIKHQSIANFHELENRFSLLEEELKEERQVARQLRDQLDSMRNAVEQAAEDVELAKTRSAQSQAQIQAAWELKYNQAQERNGELEDLLRQEQEASAQRRISMARKPSTMSRDSRQSVLSQKGRAIPQGISKLEMPGSLPGSGRSSLVSTPRMSLTINTSSAITSPRPAAGKYSLPSVVLAGRDVLPDSGHEIVLQVRQTLHEVAATMQRLITTQVDVVANQLAFVAESQFAGDWHSKIHNYSKRNELETELNKVDSTLEAHIHKLSALREELKVHHDLLPQEVRELDDIMQAELQMCEDEQRLLRESHMGALTELPRELVEGVIAMHRPGGLHGSQTLHMAAEYGRRDIVEYILKSHPESRTLLNSKDPLGRTPLDVARISEQPELERWLQQAVIGEAQPHRRSMLVPSALSTGEPVASPTSFSMHATKQILSLGSNSKKERTSADASTVAVPYLSSVPPVNRRGSDDVSISKTIAAPYLSSVPLVNTRGSNASSRLSLEWSQAQENVGGHTGPLQTRGPRPSFGGYDLPQPYKNVLDQIEESGWSSVNWKKDYTMLHWAASKGQGALCLYLVQLGASLSLRDSRGRSPADVARQAGHSEVAILLDERSMTA